jgi:acetyl-CoA synthetase
LALEAELERVRASGLAVEMEEYALGISALAAPLPGPKGEVLGALGVVVPARRFPFAFSRLARALSEVAQVSAHLPAPEPPPLPPPGEVGPQVEVVEPPRELLEKANLQDFPALYRQSLEDLEGFWGDFA